MRAKHVIPNAVTLMGAGAALLSLLWAREHPYWACNALIAAALFDMIDGRVARALDAQSAVGEQLDSLVDIIAFGVAPAWLLYAEVLHGFGRVAQVPPGVLVMFAFVAASAVRLARFNVRGAGAEDSFEGIPTPVAALLLVTAMMTRHEVGWRWFGEPAFLTALALGAAVLMVAPIRFPSFKRFKTRAGMILYFGSICGGLTMLFVGLPGGTVLFALVAIYVVRGLVEAALRGLRR